MRGVCAVSDGQAVDDASGRIAELVLKEDQHRQLVPDVPDAEGQLEIGTRIRVRGTFQRWHGRRQIQVIKLGMGERMHAVAAGLLTASADRGRGSKRPKYRDSGVGGASAAERGGSFKGMDSRCGHEAGMMYGSIRLGEVESFRTIKEEEHTMQNLERLVLNRAVENSLREFTVSVLRVDREIEYAAKCIVMRGRQKSEQDQVDGKNRVSASEVSMGTSWSQSIEICRTIRSCLRKLVNSGLILHVDRAVGVYATVGDWNLRRLIRHCCRDALYKWKCSKKRDLVKERLVITSKDIWLKIRNHGDEWRHVNKTLVTNMISKIMPTLSGWYYAGKGRWILYK
ncbi:uncharacterized protein T551_02682 [Pneumocystis jirovecii RU7]|uniref:CST complex subunit Stn1 N-terminal domain-containing protein n=1 Tax=Pneumocystis jirovecii (strain RU7) TaxID=1408657 RepID=A0A0W4ZIR9_PNEJ7|nr:uncharacterized protein T551_02682 [Pneumocystis jirovecii RU7]KTW28263.1 hypothetical protein T551_02682 [Pneumocystis jirovecii RU7]